jgi:hypothetical protein
MAGEGQPWLARLGAEHARTGESAFVQKLDELLAFMECRTGKLASSEQKTEARRAQW